VARCILEGCSEECGFHTDFSCVGKYRWQGKLTEELHRPIQVTTVSPPAPLAGAEVRVCDPTDADCSRPRDERVTDARGFACADLSAAPAAGFRGYLEVSHPETVPLLSFQASPLGRGRAIDDRPAVPAALMREIAKMVPVPVDPKKGQLVVAVSDCTASRAAGVVVSIDSAHDLLLYFEKQVPSPSAKATDADYGAALALNVAPGRVRVTARADGKIVACPQALVRAGSLSFVHAHPRDADTQCE
jgi:hypothetical protein